jgi:hypothetical protein
VGWNEKLEVAGIGFNHCGNPAVISTDDEEVKRLRRSGEIQRM